MGATKRKGKALKVLPEGDRRRMSDGKNAWRKMSAAQRASYLGWMCPGTTAGTRRSPVSAPWVGQRRTLMGAYQENRRMVDRWTAWHVLYGAWAAGRGWTLSRTVLLATAFELIEWPFLESRVEGRVPENLLNATTDVFAAAAGYVVAAPRT
jgi:hypothetical protein